MVLWQQTRDDEDPELEHGKAMDDMWALDLAKYTVGACSGA